MSCLPYTQNTNIREVLDRLESPDLFESKDLPSLKKITECFRKFSQHCLLKALVKFPWSAFGFLPSDLKVTCGKDSQTNILLQNITGELTGNGIKEKLRRSILQIQKEEDKERVKK